ncbi:MAG: formate C-acetyltransferase/glycerol dehydratase family glycyl radical enzyme [Deltaproteobacteria bacterium]|nr:formate C-acetyltransferase/glycerol dehydratase family glycyl radical enzyme [Deltaproteobacteria bacterium]
MQTLKIEKTEISHLAGPLRDLPQDVLVGISASPRIRRLRKRFFENSPSICVERARIVFDYYNEAKNRSLPLILQKAGAFRRILNLIPVNIYEDELIVGSLSSRPRGYPVFPEDSGDLISNELNSISARRPDPFEITDADKTELQEKILPYWTGKSSVERFASLLSSEEKEFIFSELENFSKGTGIMSLSPALFGTGGHITLDFPKVLEKGFRGIREEAIAKLEWSRGLPETNVERDIFYQAVIECCEGMIGFGLRFAKLAEMMATKEADPRRRQELYKISEICARVPGSPPTSFHEALQAVWFTYVGILQEEYDRCCSLGRMDNYLYPFYERDLSQGVLSTHQAQELLDCLWLKLGETNFINWGSYSKLAAGFPVQQQIPVGGLTPDGLDASNALTYQCIQASMNTRLHQPSITVRLHKDSPKDLLRKACELARIGTGHPSFFNDEIVIPALVDNGISIEDARNYSSVGCVGVQVSGCGKGSHNGGYFNVGAALEFTLTNGVWRRANKRISIQTGDPRNFTSFDELWDAFDKQFRHMIRIHLGMAVKVEYLQKHYSPTPYLSSLIKGCLENGTDKTNGGAIYNLGMSFRAVGLADVADSLAAIKKLVFEDKTVPMQELLCALDDNFENNEVLRQKLVNYAPHYGNDDKYADDLARDVLFILTDEFRQHKSYFGGDFQPGFGSVSSHWPFGQVLGAFPNGRKAGMPLADGIGPVHNLDQRGPTAVLKSVGKMDHAKLSGGSILNLKFPPQVVAGEKGLANFVSFLQSFVKLNVWHCQFNIVSAEKLRQAQQRPEAHQDLLVRVAGYSAYFTGLPRELQDDIIDRTEHTIL